MHYICLYIIYLTVTTRQSDCLAVPASRSDVWSSMHDYLTVPAPRSAVCVSMHDYLTVPTPRSDVWVSIPGLTQTPPSPLAHLSIAGEVCLSPCGWTAPSGRCCDPETMADGRVPAPRSDARVSMHPPRPSRAPRAVRTAANLYLEVPTPLPKGANTHV